MTQVDLKRVENSLKTPQTRYRLVVNFLRFLLAMAFFLQLGSKSFLYAMAPTAPVTQQETPLLRITGVDTSKFPDVSVSVYGEGLEGGLDATTLTLSQDDVQQTITSQTQTVGVQVLIAYDSWRNPNNDNDTTVKARLAQVYGAVSQLTAQKYLGDAKDYLAFMSFDHESNAEKSMPKLVANWSVDNNVAINALGQYEADALKAKANTSLFDLIYAGIRAFDDRSVPPNLGKFIVVFSDGFDSIGVQQLDDLKREANDRQIRILTVQTGSTEAERRRVLENIAVNTQGRFEQLIAGNELLPNLWTFVKDARQQRIVSYRSTTPQMTIIKVQAKSSAGAPLEAAFNPAPPSVATPQVKIVSPTITEITRSLPGDGRPETGTPLEQLEPKTLDIQIDVNWGTDQPRKIASVEYSIGDVSRTQQGDEAKKISFPIESLRDGEYTIRAVVTDELGQKGEATQKLTVKIGWLSLEPPVVSITEPTTNSLERKVAPGIEVRPGLPLTDFDPKQFTIKVEIQWPDGQPRELKSVEYKIADKTVIQAQEPFTSVDFLIENFGAGDYTISVRATDADGRQGPVATKPFKITLQEIPIPTQGTITFLEPTVDLIKRTLTDGKDPTQGAPITTLVPLTVAVAVDIKWNDAYPNRKLKQVEYWIGDTHQTRTEEPFNTITLPIDILDQSGYTIRVIATDEFDVKTEANKPLTIQIAWKPAIPPWAWVALGLSVISLAFAGYMWWNPRFRRRVTQIAANVGTSIGTRIWGGGNGDGVARARLERVGGGNAIPASIDLIGGINKVGRSSANATIQINDPSISRLHCRIEERNGTFWVYDEGSQNGTKVNGQKVGGNGQMLQPGNIIGMGPVKYRFELLSPPPPITVVDGEDAVTQIETGNSGVTKPYEPTAWDEAEKRNDWNTGSTVADVHDETKKNQQPGNKTKPTSPASEYVDTNDTGDATQISPGRKTKPAK